MRQDAPRGNRPNRQGLMKLKTTWTHSSNVLNILRRVREQLINTCSMELGLFLKERVSKTVDAAAQLAEQYMEAHGGTITQQKTSRSAQFSNCSSERTHQQSLRLDDKPQNKKKAVTNFVSFARKRVTSAATAAQKRDAVL